MASHNKINNDNDDYENKLKNISDLELGAIKGGGEENNDDNDNIRNNYQSNSPAEVTQRDHSNTNHAEKQQQQGSTSVTCQSIHESGGLILEMMKSQQQHPDNASPPITRKNVESVNESTENNDEIDSNNAQQIIRPGAERVYPTGVPSPTTRIIDIYTNNINSPGTSSRIMSEQQEQQEQQEPMEIVATLVIDDSRRMSPDNTNYGPLIMAVTEEKKCCEINMNCSKCPKTVTFVGLMLAIALIVVAVVVLMNKPGGGDKDDSIPNLIDTPAPTPATTEAPDQGTIGTCGDGNLGNGVCPKPLHCCSEWGYCGSGDDYCTPTEDPDQGTIGTCGDGNLGNGVCLDPLHCCSEWGYCGSGDDFCTPNEAIDQGTIGACGDGNRGNGVCPDPLHCCSEWGYCGSGDDYCTTTPTEAPTPTELD